MSEALGLGLIALLLAMWAINWARRAGNAAERAAIAAEKSALAAERSALAARRSAETVAAAAQVSSATAAPEHLPATDSRVQGKTARIDALVKELIEVWSRDSSAWPLVERYPELADDEVEAVIQKAFYTMGRTADEARQHAVAVLNFRRDHKP
ncbi:MAG: hypothetical protein ABI624_00770 [Casimicrobiaceae bacterium]